MWASLLTGGGGGVSTGLLTPLMSSQLVYGDGVDDIKVNKHSSGYQATRLTISTFRSFSPEHFHVMAGGARGEVSALALSYLEPSSPSGSSLSPSP